MEKILNIFKRAILAFVLIILMIVLALGALELALEGFRQFLSPPRFLLDVSQLTEVLSIVLMLVIGVELIESIEVSYFSASHEGIGKLVQYIILIAIIAIGRKVIILDLTHMESMTLVGIGAIILALGVCYFLLRHIDKKAENIDEE